MTETTYSLERHGDRGGERGVALVAVLLLLMMMTALAGALSVGSQTETFISRNENSGAMAQAAAEAGLNHAVELAVTYIFEYKSNGLGSADEAVNKLLQGPDGLFPTADDTSLAARVGIDAAEDIPLEVTAADRLPIAGATGVSYTAWVTDDDGTAPAGAYAEDGDLNTDINKRILVYATGYGPDGSKITLEATLGPVPLSAIVTEGDLTLDGSVEINGPADPSDGGAVHTNSNLTISGNGGAVTGNVTATGEVDNGNAGISASGGAPRVDIPPVSASDWEVWATHKLNADGTVLEVSSGISSNCGVNPKPAACSGWEWDGSSTWSLSNNDSATGTYYVDADVNISSNQTMTLTVIATGNIDVSGNPELTPHTTELMFVTDKDLRLLGNLATDLVVQGQMLVHEQLEIGGSVTLGGQLIVEDAASTSSLVEYNSIHGNVRIDYAGGLGTGNYSVVGWRDVRDAD